MAADKLGRGVDDDVGAMLERSDDDRGKGVVHDEHDPVPVRHGSNAFEVGDIRVRVAEGLGIDHFGVGPDGSLEGFQIIDIQNGILNTLRGEGVGDQVVGTAVEVVGGDDVVAVLQDVLQGVGDSGGAGSDRQAGHATLEGGNALLEHTLGGVGQPAVNITRVAQAETVGRVLGVAENIRSRLINRNCAGIRCGVRGLLADMDGQRLNMVIFRAHMLLVFVVVCCKGRVFRIIFQRLFENWIILLNLPCKQNGNSAKRAFMQSGQNINLLAP